MHKLSAKDKESIVKLDKIQRYLENEICFAAIDAEDLHHEDEDIIIRGFTFSQGTREEAVVIGEDGYIYYHHQITDVQIRPNITKEVCLCLFEYLILNKGENADE